MEEPRRLIDVLLAEQGQLTVVERFARAHEACAIAEPRYRELIPLSLPERGQQFAFEVDLDRCSGCKACVTACHALNGLDEGEAWREVDSLISDDWRRPFQQTVTSACHHCVDPACLNGCPVLAYEKDSVTGIVRHLDDQCIGCQYCVMMCPYDVPKYSEARGIVRKCDMCSQRLAVNEAPACAQACPNEAIRITIVDQAAVAAELCETETGASGTVSLTPRILSLGAPASRRQVGADEVVGETSALPGKRNCAGETPALPGSGFLPASPDPAFTLPTTRFLSKRGVASDLIPGDHSPIGLQSSHWPLVFMLVLTQLAAGVFALLPFVPDAMRPRLAIIGLIPLLIGLIASTAHLGKPLKAWRSFLGLRKSWLSREIVVFGVFAFLAAATAIRPATWGFYSFVAVIAVAGVFCSAMVYESTPRPLWHDGRSLGRFFGTMMLLGLAAAWASGSKGCAVALILAVVFKLSGEHRLLAEANAPHADNPWAPDGNFADWSLCQSAVLLRDQLGLVTRGRFLLGIIGGIVLPLFTFLKSTPAVIPVTGLLLCLFGELAERYTFFRAVVPPKPIRRHD